MEGHRCQDVVTIHSSLDVVTIHNSPDGSSHSLSFEDSSSIWALHLYYTEHYKENWLPEAVGSLNLGFITHSPQGDGAHPHAAASPLQSKR